MATVTADATVQYRITYDQSFKPSRSRHASVKSVTTNGKKTFWLRNALTDEYYELDDLSAEVWESCSGSLTIKEIVRSVGGGHEGTSDDDVIEALQFFAEEGVLAGSEPEVDEPGRIHYVSPFELLLALFKDSTGFLTALHRPLHFVFRRPLLYASFGIILLTAIIAWPAFPGLLAPYDSIRLYGSAALGLLFYFFVVLLPVFAIHEIAHGIACVHYGARPRDIGIGLYFFNLVFYCDTTDSWRLDRRARIMIVLAGPIASLLIASASFALGSLLGGPSGKLLLLTSFFVFYSQLLQLAPLLESDAYYIFSDLLNITNLKQEAFGHLGRSLRQIFQGKPAEKSAYSRRMQSILIGFTLFTIAWIGLIAYVTLLVLAQVVQDALSTTITLGQQAIQASSFSWPTLGLAAVSFGYLTVFFGGYGMTLKAAVVSLRKRHLRFETVHDKQLAIFAPIPWGDPAVLKRLDTSLRKTARSLSKRVLSTASAGQLYMVLRLGRVEQALNLVRAEMGVTEDAFRDSYAKVLSSCLDHMKMSPARNHMVSLAKHLDLIGRRETMSLVEQELHRRERNSLALMHSSFGTIWTIEISPNRYEELRDELLYGLLLEDLSATDLFGDAEDFKKRIILGLDSISQLSKEKRNALAKIDDSMKTYQATAFYEPIRGRILVVGRTQTVEEKIGLLGKVFMVQSWSGYFDHLLEEATLGLDTLEQQLHAPQIDREAVDRLLPREVVTLASLLSATIDVCHLAEQAVIELKEKHDVATAMSRSLAAIGEDAGRGYRVGLLPEILAVNRENLRRVGPRLSLLQASLSRMTRSLQRVSDRVTARKSEAERFMARQRRKWLAYYPLFLAASLALPVAGLFGDFWLLAIVIFACLQIGYWLVLLPRIRAGPVTGTGATQDYVNLLFAQVGLLQAVFPIISDYALLSLTTDIERERHEKQVTV